MPTILGYHLLARRFLPVEQGQAKRQAFLLGAQGEDFLRDPPHPFRRKEAPLDAFADYVNALSAAELLAQAAELGYAPSAFKLGECYEYGKMGCPQDAALSIHYYVSARGTLHDENVS